MSIVYSQTQYTDLDSLYLTNGNQTKAGDFTHFLKKTDHNLSQFSAPHTAHTVIARCDATPELLRRVELTLMTIFFIEL